MLYIVRTHCVLYCSLNAGKLSYRRGKEDAVKAFVHIEKQIKDFESALLKLWVGTSAAFASNKRIRAFRSKMGNTNFDSGVFSSGRSGYVKQAIILGRPHRKIKMPAKIPWFTVDHQNTN